MTKLLYSLILATALATPAFAVNVAITPGSYQGNWMIEGVSDFAQGGANLNLNPGTYKLWVGSGSSFSFLVAANGDITVMNAAAAVGGNRSLQFNTTNVVVSAGQYAGFLLVAHVSDYFTNAATVTLVPGLRYNIYVGPLGIVPFDVDAAGNVTSGNTAAAVGGSGQITLQTADLNVNTGQYQGLWLISHVSDFARGSKAVKIVPGLAYDFYIGMVNTFRIQMAANGAVTTTNTTATTGGSYSLTINSVAATVNAGNYQGYWKLAHLNEFVRGTQAVRLVPGASYDLLIGSLAGFRVDVAANSNITSSNTSAATGGRGVITFANTELVVDPGEYTGYWQLDYVTDPVQGTIRVVVVPNLPYAVSGPSGDNGYIQLGVSGDVTESNVILGGVPFGFQDLDDLDDDNDGVSNQKDLCPNTKKIKPKHRERKIDDDGCSRQQRLKLIRKEIRDRLREIFKWRLAELREKRKEQRDSLKDLLKKLKLR